MYGLVEANKDSNITHIYAHRFSQKAYCCLFQM